MTFEAMVTALFALLAIFILACWYCAHEALNIEPGWVPGTGWP